MECVKDLNSEYLNSGFSLTPFPPCDPWLVPSVAQRQRNEHFFAAIRKLSSNAAISHLNTYLENDLWGRAGHMMRRLPSQPNNTPKAVLLSPLSKPSILFANYNSRISHSFQFSLYQEFTLHIFFFSVVLSNHVSLKAVPSIIGSNSLPK